MKVERAMLTSFREKKEKRRRKKHKGWCRKKTYFSPVTAETDIAYSL